jgi:hypothetical protein
VKIIQQAKEYLLVMVILFFLFAVNGQNISIEGKGTVDGNGLAFL